MIITKNPWDIENVILDRIIYTRPVREAAILCGYLAATMNGWDRQGLRSSCKGRRHGATRESRTVWVVSVFNGYTIPEPARQRDRLTRLSLGWIVRKPV